METFALSTHYKETWDKIKYLYGDTFTFWESLKLGGIGSPRLILINSTDEETQKLINRTNASKNCNIQLLKNGFLIRFRSKNDEYGIGINFSEIKVLKISRFKEDESLEDARIATFFIKPDQKIDLIVRRFELNRFNRFIENFLSKKDFDIIKNT
ncbi:hypothetical protein OO013_10165 [Mangrovivirga sp. M17]|uniref:Uncharacterized protein n=1 Tax=Mangrovivirga halotolerans TaxID=2993936 RepID=A0ABT3RSL0_9BACT|nr:hypothetical protein [Mangrovivirga halotolerans]MCX2744232.1 hypothetical protein [Mangrovivirga halotolerans]